MQVYLAVQGAKRRWYLDSGYSRHMMSDKVQFVTLDTKERGVVTFEDNNKGHIVGISKIQLTPLTFLKNVLLVRGLKHNLISISQLCDKGFKVLFEAFVCIVTNLSDDSTVFIDRR